MKSVSQVLLDFARTVNVTPHVTLCEGWRPPFPTPVTTMKLSLVEGGEMGRDASFDDFLACGFRKGLKPLKVIDYYSVAFRYRRRLLSPGNQKGLVMMTSEPLSGPSGGSGEDLFAIVLVVDKRTLLLDRFRSEIDVINVDTVIARPTRLLSWRNYDFVFKGRPKKK